MSIATAQPTYNAGYAPARTPSPGARAATPSSPPPAAPATEGSSTTSTINQTVTRVRALYNFEPTEQGELAFERGDIIKVVDRNYVDWWRGQLKGRTGIFPVNYVVSGPKCLRSILV
jgi:signal transducing adaptor molecule